MSYIQTLPFPVDELRATGTSNYEARLGDLFHSKEGVYRLIKAGSGLNGSSFAGKALTASGNDFTATGDSNANAANILGWVDARLSTSMTTGDFFLVLVEGKGYVIEDGGGIAVGQAVGTDAAGLADDGATTNIAIVVEATATAGASGTTGVTNAIKIELYTRQVLPGA